MPSKLRNRLIVGVLVALVLLGGGIALLRPREPVPASPFVAPAAPASAPVAAAPPRVPAPEKDPALAKEVEAFRAEKPVARVQRFYEAESRRVGAIDQDPDLTARRLAAMAAELNPAEVEWLKNAALDLKQPGDGRFFAAYLLAQAPSPATVSALKDIALSPLPVRQNLGLVELEKQVRAQATEGLGHARGLPEAQDSLLDVVEYQKDEFLRDRAHRALYEWRTGKRLEEQDEAALRKVMEKGPR